MKWTGLNELREIFLSFFESKGHLRQKSASLVPQDDGSLLLINSGMAPLKNYFLGLETPPSNRMTTCQKCIRTLDIEEVGKTSRHGSYFEMLGNFSFGDYFKKEAIAWAWELFIDVLEIPEERVWVSIYEEDDEAFEIWTTQEKVNPERIVRLGKEHNFWEIGSGPCGPCSELYFDRGEEYSCGDNCGIGKCECDRYMEIWNLVFTQYNSDGEGNYTPLEHPNIDTGMGLERIAVIMQEVDNLFEVDTVQNIINTAGSIAGVTYKEDETVDVSLRVIADHARATVFLIGDGVIPSNEGRGYVLRRLLRRAARHGHLLGVKEPFLHKVADTVISENKNVYPELDENKDYIKKIILAEEERFATTIQAGMEMLDRIIENIEDKENPTIMGKDVFQLYDTFGFPIDLTREIAEDHNVAIDEEGFKAHMEEQRKRARDAQAQQGGVGWDVDVLAGSDITDEFVGYKVTEQNTKILAIINDSQLVDNGLEGQELGIILEKTPFYAESGGQVGDTGTIVNDKNVFRVTDCQKTPTGHYLHIGKMEKGSLSVDQEVSASVDKQRRYDIMRNHTATHLLQSALRELLGDHVHQAGSYVSNDIARFDFTHFSAVTPEQLKTLEDMVNANIEKSIDVSVEEMSMDSAKDKGALALFGDKYSDVVRVCSVGDGVSTELCGGTHVSNTAQISLFKIISESSVAAGVRRIEAITGNGILHLLEKQQQQMKDVAAAIKVNSLDDMLNRVNAMNQQITHLEKEVTKLEGEIAKDKTANLGDNMVKVGSVELVTIAVEGAIDPLQVQADQLKTDNPNIVGVMIAYEDGKGTALAFAGKDAVKAGIHAGNLVREVASIAGGGGGGRPDNARGGVNDLSKIDDALNAVEGIVTAQLK